MNHAVTMPRKLQRGFTLVELLAAMILFSMIIGMTAWAVIGATDTTTGAEKQMDTTSQARAFLDRFGADLNTMITDGGITAFYNGGDGSGGNSAIGFICRSRPRATSGDRRGVVVAYRINTTKDIDGKDYPMASRGDGTLLYVDPTSSINPMRSIIEKASSDLSDGGNDILNWQVLGTGIIRFHISFLLNTGKIVQTPPEYINYITRTDQIFPKGVNIDNSCKFIPFRAEDSNEIDPEDPDRRRRLYVVGLVASVAVLDTRTRDQAFKSDTTGTFPSKFERPPAGSDKTALSAWNDNLGNSTVDISKPVRANIRFYERMYTVR